MPEGKCYFFYPFFNWECKGNGLYFITQIYLDLFLFFPLKKPPFLIGSAKVSAAYLTTKSNFYFFEIIFDFNLDYCL